jgi:hypothetical protein
MRLLSIIVFTVVLISNTFGQTTPTIQVKTIADLVALRIPTINNRLSALVTGRVTENDGGGGLFFYEAASAVSTNLGTVFKPAASDGRWRRQYSGSLNVKWFGAVGDNVNDDTTAIQAALNLLTDSGTVFVPAGGYRITSSLTFPAMSVSARDVVSLVGENYLSSILINVAPASNPTVNILRESVVIRDIGFIGDQNYPNDSINVGSPANRVRIEHCLAWAKGNGIKLNNTHSIWIQNCQGAGNIADNIASVFGLNAIVASGTDSFVELDIDGNGSFLNLVTVDSCLSEGYIYPVHTTKSGTGYMTLINILNNQFEGSVNGLLIDSALQEVNITGNYLGEGTTGFAIDIDNSRGGVIGPNYIHQGGVDAKNACVKLNDSERLFLLGTVTRYLFTGTSDGYVVTGSVERVQDETTNQATTYLGVTLGTITVPKSAINRTQGKAVWYSDTLSFTSYPFANSGDVTVIDTPSPGDVPSYTLTTAAATGALVQTVGAGPDPTMLTDYFYYLARDYKIVITTGGETGTAVYKVQDKIAGGGVYGDLEIDILSSELAHLVASRFQVKWPTGVSYVIGDEWELTSVVAPVWTANVGLYTPGTANVLPKWSGNVLADSAVTDNGATVASTLPITSTGSISTDIDIITTSLAGIHKFSPSSGGAGTYITGGTNLTFFNGPASQDRLKILGSGEIEIQGPGVLTSSSSSLTIQSGPTNGDILLNPSGSGAVGFEDRLYITGVTNAYAAGDGISSAGIIEVSGFGGAVTMTSTPTVIAGRNGEVLIIIGTSNSNTLAFQDNGTLPGSTLFLGGANKTLGSGDTLVLVYRSSLSGWFMLSFSDN